MPDLELPDSVRYVKNGRGGAWWNAAKANAQVHAGWDEVKDSLLKNKNLGVIHASSGLSTQDFTALSWLIDRPSRHVWVTVEEGRLWWCTVRDEINVAAQRSQPGSGHFWLTCDRPWSDKNVMGRPLYVTELPGAVAAVAGFRATVCVPSAADQLLRVIQGIQSDQSIAAATARSLYEAAVGELIALLGWRDFELLIELILTRTGWRRVTKLGGSTAHIDLKVFNDAIAESAFVQVKQRANQSELNNYICQFTDQTSEYQRMIFASNSFLSPLEGSRVQVWDRKTTAALAIDCGLGSWVSDRV